MACAYDIGGDDNYVDGDNDGDMTTASVAKVVPVAISSPQRG